MPKRGPRFGQYAAIFLMRREKRVESDLSQRDDHANGFEKFELSNQVGPAAFEFIAARFIIRRCATNGGGNVTIREFEAVISLNRVRLIGETSRMQRSIEPVAAAVPGKYSAGSISPVRRWCQADNQQPRLGIAKAGQRFRPVGLPSVSPRRIARNLLAPAHQPRAFAASSYRPVKLFDLVHGGMKCSVSTKPRPRSMRAAATNTQAVAGGAFNSLKRKAGRELMTGKKSSRQSAPIQD